MNSRFLTAGAVVVVGAVVAGAALDGAGQAPAPTVDCSNASQIVTRMSKDLPKQDEAIRRLEEARNAARGVVEKAPEAMKQKIFNGVVDEMIDVGKQYVKYGELAKDVAGDVAKGGISAAQQAQQIRDGADYEIDFSLWKSLKTGYKSVKELRAAEGGFSQKAFKLNQLIVDSGIADKTFDVLTGELFKINPPAAGLAKLAKLELDIIAIDYESRNSDNEARELDKWLDVLYKQRQRLQDRVSTLTQSCLQPKLTENTRREAPRADAPPASAPTTPPAQAPAAKKKSSSGKTAAKIGAAAAVGVGTAVAVNEGLKAIEEANSLPSAPSPSGGGSPSSSSNRYDGTYRAVVSRSCTPGGASAQPCLQFLPSGSCSPTDFTFRITNGVETDCGPWFGTGTRIDSSGRFTGSYQGSYGAPGISVSGTAGQSWDMSGSAVLGGATYRVTIQVTKQ